MNLGWKTASDIQARRGRFGAPEVQGHLQRIHLPNLGTRASPQVLTVLVEDMASSATIDDYKVGVICALPLERTAVESMLDSYHDLLPTAPGDNNTYSFGSIEKHNVVLASLGSGSYGTVSAGGVANDMRRSFPGVKFSLMVGIAGGAPRPTAKDGGIRLGDVVVGCVNGVPSVINYRLGKESSTGLDIRSELAEPPEALQRAVSALETQHQREGPTYLKHLDAMFRRNPRLDRPQISVDYYNQPQVPDYLFEADFVHPQDAADCEGRRESMKYVVTRGPRFLRDPPAEVETAKFIKLRDDRLPTILVFTTARLRPRTR